MADAESLIEQQLIDQLSTGQSQWTYRKDLNTEEKLWQNIRAKLNSINAAKLNNVNITDNEMVRIQNFVKNQGDSPYKAAVWLSGENGVVQIPLERDDPSLGTVYLTAINQNDIAGGFTTYEVINQYQSHKVDPTDRNRRFDVTLLINGFPMIQVELKNQNVSILDAFTQISKYAKEGKFRGLFGLIQMFVVSNGVHTKYFVANDPDKLSPRFMFSWVDKNNKPVEHYLEFAKEALKIPTAHQMIGRYLITDAEAKSLIILRPYQIHAIEEVESAVHRKESGYIWHTTGSGKTLTSFNVAKNICRNLEIDKTIFLIDRKDLDQQTTLSFQAYAKHTGDLIEETENTKALEECLLNKDRSVIIATRQKLERIINKCDNALKSKDESNKYYKIAKKLKSKNVAFIVDECHRAISPTTKDEFSKFFDKTTQKSLWYGFTGTPIFAENKKAENGKSARTTNGQYGPCLHKYTIKEALHDDAVLGFKIENAGFSENELSNIAYQLKLKNYETMCRTDLEKIVLSTYKNQTRQNLYDSKEHRERVINYIVNKSNNKFNLKASKGDAFAAILTCSSIEIAQKYYDEFKEFKKSGKVSKTVISQCKDFPRFAITYSVGENEDGAHVNQTKMKEAIKDYNENFGTNYSLENIASYNADLNHRLARKHSKYKIREQQLDLVIVVDRLLTGFDAPCISTLFIDRPPQAPQNIVQAFSRTNRVFTTEKKWGQIVTFQTPATYKIAYEKALSLYSNGGSGYVTAPTFDKAATDLSQAINKLKELCPNPKEFDIDANKNSETTINKLKHFAKAYQCFDKALSSIKTFEEWETMFSKNNDDYLENLQKENSCADKVINQDSIDSNDNSPKFTQNNNEFPLNQIVQDTIDEQNKKLVPNANIIEKTLQDLLGITISQENLNTLSGKYKDVIRILKDYKPKTPFPIDGDNIDIEYQIELVSSAEVDYDYVLSLMQKYVPDGDDIFIQIHDPEIEKHISDIEARNHKFGEIIRCFWEELKVNPQEFKGQQVRNILNDKIDKFTKDKIAEFCNEWGLTQLDVSCYIDKYISDPNAKFDIWNADKTCDEEFERYREQGGTLNKLQYKKNVRNIIPNFVEVEIMPLKRR